MAFSIVNFLVFNECGTVSKELPTFAELRKLFSSVDPLVLKKSAFVHEGLFIVAGFIAFLQCAFSGAQ